MTQTLYAHVNKKKKVTTEEKKEKGRNCQIIPENFAEVKDL
jgi:hypothetical protein